VGEAGGPVDGDEDAGDSVSTFGDRVRGATDDVAEETASVRAELRGGDSEKYDLAPLEVTTTTVTTATA
jgi:hypothetical protein